MVLNIKLSLVLRLSAVLLVTVRGPDNAYVPYVAVHGAAVI